VVVPTGVEPVFLG